MLSLFGLATCHYSEPPPEPNGNAPTYRPVYLSTTELRTLQVLDPQPLRSPGKIYVKDLYLLVGETGRGIHVIDNADPANPRKLVFISIPGNSDFAIKDNTLYANNGPDLVAYDISNLQTIRQTRRIENVLPAPQNYPDLRNVRFECVDPAKGYVVRWEAAPVSNPQCYR